MEGSPWEVFLEKDNGASSVANNVWIKETSSRIDDWNTATADEPSGGVVQVVEAIAALGRISSVEVWLQFPVTRRLLLREISLYSFSWRVRNIPHCYM